MAGDDHFENAVAALPMGPLKVTLALIPNKDNPFAIVAMVGDVQVGWMTSDWSATDPYVRWMRKLKGARIRPRLDGERGVFGGHNTPIINFSVPSGRGNEDLDLVAERVIVQGPA